MAVHVYGDPRIQDQVRIRIIDGDLPDAAWVAYILWPALIRAGKLADLRPYLAGPNWDGDARWGDTFQAGALDSWRIGGGVYGLPFGYGCWSLFYNRGLFREHGWAEPRTWDEFFALCDQDPGRGDSPGQPAGDPVAVSGRVLPRRVPRARRPEGMERDQRP